MKYLISLIFSILVVVAYAQKHQPNVYVHTDYLTTHTRLTQPKGHIKNVDEASSFLKEYLHLPPENNLKLVSEIESPHQRHYTFIQTFQGIEVYQAYIKLNTDKTGNITSILSSKQDITNVSKMCASSVNLREVLPKGVDVNKTKQVWIEKDGIFYKSILVRYTQRNQLVFDMIIDGENKPAYQVEITQHISDTTARGYVFAPDPITSASTTYNNNYRDFNDLTNPELDSERLDVELLVRYDENQQLFILENEYVKIVDLDLPTIEPATSTTPTFYYDRSQTGFENVNALYHITRQQQYLQSLGFTNLVNYQIEVDCHALSSADNSLFNYASTPPSILFGQGGVDDAEDADVIIHEYTHAISHSAAPNTNFGTERRAIDEAIGDYLAASYSRTYSYWQDNWVYNWDGHNEYWSGRVVTSNAMYPDDLQHNIYSDAPIWSSALLRIERNIGRDSTHALILNAMYNFSGNMKMAQAAQLVLQQDSLLFNSKYHGYVCYTFLDKGLVETCQKNRPNNMVGVAYIDKNTPHMINSDAFARGLGNVEFIANNLFTVEVYTLSGSLLYQNLLESKHITLYSSRFKPGIYIVKLSFDNEVKTFKISKF